MQTIFIVHLAVAVICQINLIVFTWHVLLRNTAYIIFHISMLLVYCWSFLIFQNPYTTLFACKAFFTDPCKHKSKYTNYSTVSVLQDHWERIHHENGIFFMIQLPCFTTTRFTRGTLPYNGYYCFHRLSIQ